MSDSPLTRPASVLVRNRAGLVGACLFLVTLALYWPSIHYDFVVVDDDQYVYENPHVTGGLTPAGLRWALTSTYAANWHPVTWATHMLDCSWHGLFPGGHHLTNILLHSASTLLLFLFLNRYTAQLGPSALVAGLFGWHPLHVESVAWIAERKDVLSTFFGLLTLLFYGRYAQRNARSEVRRVGDQGSSVTRQVSGDGGEGRAKVREVREGRWTSDFKLWTVDFGLALVFFALGLMSKPMLVTLPFVMLLLDYWPLDRISGARGEVQSARGEVSGAGNQGSDGAMPESAAPLSPTGREGARGAGEGAGFTRGEAWILVREKWPFLVLALLVSAITVAAQHSGGAIKSMHEVPLYMRFLNAPMAYAQYVWKSIVPLDLCVFYPVPAKVLFAPAAGAILALAAITVVAIRRRSVWPWWIVGWLWFLGTLVPVIGLVQIGNQGMADRYMYIPAIGLFLIFSWALLGLARRGRGGRMVSWAVAAAVLAACAALTRSQLAYWHDSISLFTHALSVTGSNAFSENNLGVALANAGRGAEAIPHYEAALRLNPKDVKARYNLGIELAAAGDLDQALSQFRAALERNPKSEKLHNNAGVILAQQGKLEAAVAEFQQAIELNPEYPKPYLNYAVALQRQGRAGPAVTNYLKALELDPGWPEALAKLAFLLSACPDPAWRNPASAIRLAEQANQLTRYESPFCLHALALAYGAAGRFSNAVSAAGLALDKARAQGLTPLAGVIQTNLQAFAAGEDVRPDWRTGAHFEIQR